MANLIIKPNSASGDKLIIQDRAGGAVLTTADSGATVADGIALGTPASGVLTNMTGAIGSTVTGFTGFKEFDQWRVTSGFAGDANPITTNFERNDGHGSSGGFSKLGTGMTQSSGVFTFPSTGYWYIHFAHNHYSTGANRYCFGNILCTTNNGSGWDAFGLAKFHISDIGEYAHTSAHQMAFFDVTNTSTHKVAFRIYKDSGGTAVTTNGETGDNSTYMTFIRIGDT